MVHESKMVTILPILEKSAMSPVFSETQSTAERNKQGA
jgi:hypothetical protein